MKYRDLIQFAPLQGVLQLNGVQVFMTAQELRLLISEKLARKTPEQIEQVKKHLSRFVQFYPKLTERMEEFAALFPVHPDYLEVLAKINLPGKRELLQFLSDEVQELLDQSIPEDQSGLISYDSCWVRLRTDPAFRNLPEIEAIADATRSLEQKIATSFPATHKHLALRLLHALCIQRLTTEDIYSPHGPTAAELRDQLCLDEAGLEVMPGNPAENLLSLITTLLQEIRQADRGETIAEAIKEPLPGPILDEAQPIPEGPLAPGSVLAEHYLHFRNFRRFVKPELFLHWVNAVLFLLLMLTGGIMLGSRFGQLERQWFNAIRIVHITLAVFWMGAMPLTVFWHLGVHWLHLRAILNWGKDDLRWVVQSIRSLYTTKAVLPPVGRFNTGQKINATLVMLYLIGFAATGILMLFRGSILVPWYAHTALFFATIASVVGHLYLSIVHPSTRVSLPGIFHGWSPMEYVKHHHPLCLPPSLRGPGEHLGVEEDELFASKVELIIPAAVLLMAGVGLFAFQQGQLATVQKAFAKSFGDAITPNQLSTKHRIGAPAESCTKCHLYTGEIPDAKCEACHALVKERRDKGIGYHGTFQGDCMTCHPEHPDPTQGIIPVERMDKKNFNHDLALYKLTGKHAKLECDECHKKHHPPKPEGYYLGLKFDLCTDCHRDIHNGQLAGTACEKCHNTVGWTGKELIFDHNRDCSYRLDGKHEKEKCAKCHKPDPGAVLGTAVWRGLTNTCIGCHKDPHSGQFAAQCTPCHTTHGWKTKTLAFDHNKDSKYPLLLKHAEVACEQCHVPEFGKKKKLGTAKFRNMKMECVDCHKDPHSGQFAAQCTPCHTLAGWKKEQLSFNHDKDSKYPLVAKHAEVVCDKCHVPDNTEAKLASAKFRQMKTECVDCHKDPHSGQFAAQCTPCHTLAGWKKEQLSFNHDKDSKYPLVGKHATTDCIKCHIPPVIGASLGTAPLKGVPTACEPCHKVKHPETYGPLCVSCHAIEVWQKKPWGVEHIQRDLCSGEHLSGKHLLVECRACHKETSIAEVGQVRKTEYQCHTCHKAEDPHKGTLGLNCAPCHSQGGWKGEHVRFNHDTMTRWPLDQDHRKVACVKCHENNLWKPVDSRCQSCHPKKF